MDIELKLSEQKIGLLCAGLTALNHMAGRTLEESAAIIGLFNELQAAKEDKE